MHINDCDVKYRPSNIYIDIIRSVRASTRIVFEGKHVFVCLMVLNATFNDISATSWWSVLLVEETGGPGGPGESARPIASH